MFGMLEMIVVLSKLEKSSRNREGVFVALSGPQSTLAASGEADRLSSNDSRCRLGHRIRWNRRGVHLTVDSGRLDVLWAVARNMAGLAAAVASLARAVQRSAVRSCTVARNVA